jgi:hypothetical protein
MNKILQREIEVAFSKHSQPVWFRVTKWVVIIIGVYFLHDKEFFWPLVLFLTVVALALHLLWRYKTNRWTQSWIGWDYEKNKPRSL